MASTIVSALLPVVVTLMLGYVAGWHRDFDGTIYLVFQPAEEGGGGAREMIRDGLFERFPMEAMFGIHNWPGLAAGQFALAPGPVFASSNDFRIVIRGRGAHAAAPHAAIDPVPVACQMVQAFQSIIARNSARGRDVDWTRSRSMRWLLARASAAANPEAYPLNGRSQIRG